MAKATVVIHRDVADVFDFLAKPRNLLDAAWGGRWQTDSLDQIGLGSRITGSKQHRPFKLTPGFPRYRLLSTFTPSSPRIGSSVSLACETISGA